MGLSGDILLKVGKTPLSDPPTYRRAADVLFGVPGQHIPSHLQSENSIVASVQSKQEGCPSCSRSSPANTLKLELYTLGENAGLESQVVNVGTA